MTSDKIRRFAVFSDVHGNLPALQKFLGEVEALELQQIYCLGDLVGYGAHPNECCELVRLSDMPAVIGNHDLVAADPEASLLSFNEVARQAALWTREQLSEDNREFLRSLPYTIQTDHTFFAHASPCRPEEWNYVLTQGEAMDNFGCFQHWLAFIGHSHQPFVVQLKDNALSCPESRTIKIDPESRYLVNVGSLGQPRNRDPKSSYVIVDLDQGEITFKRMEYPVFEAQRAILEAGLPVELADRLSKGW